MQPKWVTQANDTNDLKQATTVGQLSGPPEQVKQAPATRAQATQAS